jgi:hypothetical protein
MLTVLSVIENDLHFTLSFQRQPLPTNFWKKVFLNIFLTFLKKLNAFPIFLQMLGQSCANVFPTECILVLELFFPQKSIEGGFQQHSQMHFDPCDFLDLFYI